ncbi:MAG: hypothetical protein AAFO81_10535 [Pseudomonadota bacterium]
MIVAKVAAESSVILTILPDSGDCYLSTLVFANVEEGSDDGGLATISG